MGALRILYVEDDPVSRMMLTVALESHGHEVTAVADAHAAFDSAEAQVFDVVLMDVHLPDMDGIEASRTLSRSAGGAPPIIAVTADRTRQTLDLCSHAGISSVVLKPVSISLLQSALQKIKKRS